MTAGGIAGYALSPNIQDVYAVGNVTGRGAVGGLVGNLDCTESPAFLYKGIYRGDVVDRNRSLSGGWAGTVGLYKDCGNRVEMLYWDLSVDPSQNSLNLRSPRSATTAELRSPTTPIGGVFCAPDVTPGRCGDLAYSDPPWDAGTSSQHHARRNMPGPNAQPR